MILFFFLQQEPAVSWSEEHRNCCANQSWKDRLSAAQRQPPPLKKKAISRTNVRMASAFLVEETSTMMFAESRTAVSVVKEIGSEQNNARSQALIRRSERQKNRHEEQRDVLEHEKAAARSRTRENVLRHYGLPVVLVTAGFVAGGAWMMRKLR